MGQAQKPTLNRTWAAFTLIELLVVIAIIGLLAGLLLPVLARSSAKAKSAECLNNLRQWNIALSLYLDENAQAIPRRGQGVQPLFVLNRPDDWFNALPPLLSMQTYETIAAQGKIPKPGDHNLFVCPVAQGTTNTNFMAYAMDMYLSPWVRPNPHYLTEIPHPSTLVFMADGPGGYSSTVPSVNAYSVPARHARRANVAFLDAHAASFAGDYLGCGTGAIEQPDVHWQTGTDGVNQPPVP